jgi:long-chain acyl-CoA synthetase
MHSDVNFCIADMGCLLAQLVNVPIDLTQTLEHIIFVLQHSEAKALVISNLDLLAQVEPYLIDTFALRQVIVANVPSNWQQTRLQWVTAQPNSASDTKPRSQSEEIPESACLDVPMVLHPAQPDHPHARFPQGIQVFSLDEVRLKGQAQLSETTSQQLRATLTPYQLATLIYIPDATGQLEGVMLTHENLAANALASFSGLPDLELGAQEVVLSFLPLNHVLARVMLYGHLNYGHSIYFSTPNRVMKHLKEVQPTLLVTVPLFLEKVYGKILEKGSKSTSAFERIIFHWGLKLAKQYELGQQPNGLYAPLLKLADGLVLSKWRAVFGDRLKYVICGGAALQADLANIFAAAGVTILQGYGLTQASAVVCCNRGAFNRAGTVGVPIAGVEVAIADDGEILVRGPYVTPGYYKNPEATQEAIDQHGWFHTGDLGAFTEDGFLKITGIKKALFKLSTGKYIAPQPIEHRVKRSPFVAQAIAVGSERKFCAMLIVPNLQALHTHALDIGIDLPIEALLKHPCTLGLYQALVNAANCRLPYWATVKRFRLINVPLTVENGLLTPTQEINRTNVLKRFATEIDALYGEDATRRRDEADQKGEGSNVDTSVLSSLSPPAAFACPDIPAEVCPAYAQSLNPRLTI